jgi:ectoine hydroxylase
VDLRQSQDRNAFVVSLIDRRGYEVIEDALDRTTLSRLLSAVDSVWKAEANGGGDLHRLAFLPLDQAFVDLVDHPATLPLVVDSLGWNIYVYHCHLDVHPRSPVAIPPVWRWHQDGGRQNVELGSPRPRLSVKVGFFLTDVESEQSGPLWVIPGSHVNDTLERPRDRGSRPRDAEPLLVRAGTAVVFDRRLWHARGDNAGGPTRKALFYAYTHRWIQPRDEMHFDDPYIRRLGPVRGQLLGAATSAIGRWIPTDEDVPLRRAAGV